MQKNNSIVIVVVIIVLGIVGYFGYKNLYTRPSVPQAAIVTSNFKTYTSTIAGYSMKYPEDYKLLENQSYGVDGVMNNNPNTTTLISPTLENLKTNMQIGIHYESGVGNLSEQAVAKKIGTTITGKQYSIGGKNGYMFADTPIGSSGSTILYVEAGNKTFTITVESMGAGYTTGLQKYVDPIFSTFHVTK